MEYQERLQRFLILPIILLVSLVVGVWGSEILSILKLPGKTVPPSQVSSATTSQQDFKPESKKSAPPAQTAQIQPASPPAGAAHQQDSRSSTEQLITIIAGAVVALMAFGFVISQITRFFFMVIERLFEMRIETSVNDETLLERVAGKYGLNWKEWSLNDRHYAIAAFHHDKMSKKLHNWVARRWHTFITITNCFTAIILSLLLYSALMPFSFTWWHAINIFLLLVLSVNAYREWKSVMGMLRFAAQSDVATPHTRLRRQQTIQQTP